MKNLLDDLNEYDLNRQGENIEYRAQGNIMTIKYSQPTVQEYRYFDVKWFCPIFFKCISLDLFIKCLFGVMLEKTIIFISKDMQKCSCAVLALRALVQPFKICFTMIPVLPQPVIDYLSAPVPLLIGVSSLLLENNNINYHESASDVGEETNWVHLDDERLSLWNSGDFPIPHLSGLRERIAKHYEFIRKHNKNLLEYQNDDIDYKVQLITDNIRETIFEYFIRQLPLGIKDVYEETKSNAIKRESKLSKPAISKDSSVSSDSGFGVDLKDFRFDNLDDKCFFTEFYYSLMFQTFLDEYTKER